MRLYSAQEAFNANLEYEVVFPERRLHPQADRELAEKLGDVVRTYIAENREKLEEGGWVFDADSVQIGQPDEHTAPFLAFFNRGMERKYLCGELNQSGEVLQTETGEKEGELGPPRLVRRADSGITVYTFKVAGRTQVGKEEGGQQADLRCHQPGCREAPLETFRLGTDQTFDTNPRSDKWTAYDKYMLALPEPPLGPDGKVTWERPHEYVTADYLNALLLEDHADEALLYLEKLYQVERLEIPSSGLPRGWRINADTAQAYRKKAQSLHDAGIRTPYAQFLRWRGQGAEEIKEILEDLETRVRGQSRIATAKRIADFPPLTSKPDILDKYAGDNPPKSYIVKYELGIEMPEHLTPDLTSIRIELKHVPNVRLTRNSNTHDRLKRKAWEFLWLRSGKVTEAEAA